MKEFFKENKEIILPAALFLIVLVLFGRIVFNSFAYDDTFVRFNWKIKTFVNPFYYFTEPKTLEVYLRGDQDVYRPLGVWLFALEYRLFGLNSFHLHLISLFLHAINTVLLFFLLKKILSVSGRSSSPAPPNEPSSTKSRQNQEARRADEKNLVLSFLGALFFAIHPGTPETVAWAIQQYSLWSWFFCFLALHLLFAEESAENFFLNKKWKKIALLAIFSFLAVFFKEHAVVLPLIYLLCILALKMNLKKRMEEIAAVTLPIILYLSLRGAVLGAFSQGDWAIGRYRIFLTMLKSFVYYFRLMVWPHPLSINYESFSFPENFQESSVIASAIILFLIISAAIFFWRKQPLFSMGIFWIFIVLGPVSNLISLTKQVVSERYLYFILPGFIISVLSIVIFIGERAKIYKKFLIPFSIFLTISISLIFSILTFIRLGDWKNDLTLWKHEIEIKPNTWKTQSNYAISLEIANKTAEAIEHYKNALRFPVGQQTIAKLAAAYIRIGEPQKAELLILNVFKHLPSSRILVYQLGHAYFEQKKYKKAEETFKNNGNDDISLFFALLSKKMDGGADEEIRTGAEKINNSAFREATPLIIKGRQKMLENRCEEAIPIFEEVLKIRPPLPLAEKPYIWIGKCFEKTNENEKALEVYRLTFALMPFSIDAAQGILRNGGTEEEVSLPYF